MNWVLIILGSLKGSESVAQETSVFFTRVWPCWQERRYGGECSLYFNECVNDKCLGLWVKIALDHTINENDEAHEAKKHEMKRNYIETWWFVYSVYHGKCLCWALSYFYEDAGDTDPPTFLVSNSPLCMICKASDMLCQESCDIKDYLCTLLSTVQHLQNAGLSSVTKTLLVSIFIKKPVNVLISAWSL